MKTFNILRYLIIFLIIPKLYCVIKTGSLIIYPKLYGHAKILYINQYVSSNTSNEERSINTYISSPLHSLFEIIYSNNLMMTLKSESIRLTSLVGNARYEDEFNRNICQKTSLAETISFSYDWVHKLIYRVLKVPRYAVYDQFYFESHYKIIISPFDKCWLEYDIHIDNDENGINKIIVNPIDQFIIWDTRIGLKKSDLDGSNVKIIVDLSLELQDNVGLKLITIDYAMMEIYYSINSLNIYAIDYFGGNKNDVFKFKHPFLDSSSIDIFNNKVYYFHDKNLYKERFETNNNDSIKPIAYIEDGFSAVKLYHSTRQRQINNICKDNNCSHICIPVNQTNYKCVCPSRSSLFPEDNCDLENPVKNEEIYLMLFTNNKIKKLSVNNINDVSRDISSYITNDFEFELNHTLYDWKYGIDFDMKNDLIFWTQNTRGNRSISKIIMSKMNNRSEDIIILNTKPYYGLIYSLSYDWVHRLIYFSDLESLKVCPIDKPFVEKELLKANTHLDSICVNPIDLFLVWTEGNAIYKSRMDATNITLLYNNSDNLWILGLTLDIRSKSLVWCERNQIVIYNYKTQSHTKHALITEYPRYVDLIFGEIYYGYKDNRFKNLYKQYSKIKSSESEYFNTEVIERIKINHSSKQPKKDNQCLKSNCEYLCIPIDTKSNRCLCPTRMGENMEENKHFNYDCDLILYF